LKYKRRTVAGERRKETTRLEGGDPWRIGATLRKRERCPRVVHPLP
jgi:hypothetical protein